MHLDVAAGPNQFILSQALSKYHVSCCIWDLAGVACGLWGMGPSFGGHAGSTTALIEAICSSVSVGRVVQGRGQRGERLCDGQRPVRGAAPRLPPRRGAGPLPVQRGRLGRAVLGPTQMPHQGVDDRPHTRRGRAADPWLRQPRIENACKSGACSPAIVKVL